ncbi:hypothetical protein DINM_003874 [Dirofilaria immitis]|nr:hypothetical protein [Dirofilaria immitis]
MQNSRKREHIGVSGKSKSLSIIKLKTNERQTKLSKEEICNDAPCTIYEAISNSQCSIATKQECIVSELVGPPTISALPSILRPSKRWHKKSYYSVDSSPKILNDKKTTMHADLLQMPTIFSPLVGSTEINNHIKQSNPYQNNAENNSQFKQ